MMFIGRVRGYPVAPRGLPEAQGGLLHPRRGLPGLRAQARPAGPDRARAADGRDRPGRRPAGEEPRRPGGDQGPQRQDPRGRPPGAGEGRPHDRRPEERGRAGPDPDGHPAPTPRLPHGPGPGPGHRQAAQPRQVGDGGVVPPAFEADGDGRRTTGQTEDGPPRAATMHGGSALHRRGRPTPRPAAAHRWPSRPGRQRVAEGVGQCARPRSPPYQAASPRRDAEPAADLGETVVLGERRDGEEQQRDEEQPVDRPVRAGHRAASGEGECHAARTAAGTVRPPWRRPRRAAPAQVNQSAPRPAKAVPYRRCPRRGTRAARR